MAFLKWLEALRIPALDKFMAALTNLGGATGFFLVCLLVIWCVDKYCGYYMITSGLVSSVLGQCLKIICRVPRPWMLDENFTIVEAARADATGYSFPSGHTVVATITYGTTAVWQWVKRRWLSVICIIMVLLTGFSRNFLGVHTPQDVFVGICESVAIIIIFGFAQKKLEGKERAKDILTIIGIIAVIAVLIYITQKPYPMDYVGDKLIVDPKVMMNDSFKASGLLFGILIGSLIERHRIHYEIPSDTKSLAMVTCIGAAIMFSWIRYFGPATVVQAFGSHWGNLISYAIMVLFALCIWPLVIRKVCKNK